MKYVLHIIDLRSENPWDNKAVYLLYTELITGIKQIVSYFSFATLIWFITFDNKKMIIDIIASLFFRFYQDHSL